MIKHKVSDNDTQVVDAKCLEAMIEGCKTKDKERLEEIKVLNLEIEKISAFISDSYSTLYQVKEIVQDIKEEERKINRLDTQVQVKEILYLLMR